MNAGDVNASTPQAASRAGRGVPPRLCALSVDLDEITHYHAIHGLRAPEPACANLVYDLAIARCSEFARDFEVPVTWFVVAADLARSANAKRVRELASAGHEIGNHSLTHPYELVRLTPSEQWRQIDGALELFQHELGYRPRGFRAPGYSVNDALLTMVAKAGHLYDSSVFPSAPYYAAKALALLALRLRGRHSKAILDSPELLTAPRRPYRIGTPYTTRGAGLLELPVQVTRGPRLPFIGTALVLAGELGARLLTELVIGEPFINLELHGIDWLGDGDPLAPLRGFQPDVRIEHQRKRAIFGGVIARMRAAGYRFVTLSDAARQFAHL
ncbi:MAG TPA: polysaccharide deacetylase family protein [Polyangiaceae bacterium]|nr:polysaccharide deacetylase family protein [Polyangiaceae bacterium]